MVRFTLILALSALPVMRADEAVERLTNAKTVFEEVMGISEKAIPADLLAKAARARQLLPEHLTANSPLRRYVAWDDDEIVGWVGSISFGAASYCDNMYVREKYRRRSIASAMLWVSRADTTLQTITVLVAITVVMLLTLLTLLAAGPLIRLIGEKVEAMITRILGVILAALATQFIVDGLKQSFPSLLA